MARAEPGRGVLHVPYTFFPDPCGGTEVYVAGLARRLTALGYPSAIAAPGAADSRYDHDGLDVHRFAVDPTGGLRQAWGEPDEVATAGFGRIVETVRPAIVHLHGRTAAVSDRLIDIAHDAGAKAVVTYHTPTMSCPRGTMMRYGATACDGKLMRRRCTVCVLQRQGIPLGAGHGVASLPDAFAGMDGAPLIVRVPGLVHEHQQGFRRLMDRADHVVAVCQWVADVLALNSVPAGKTTLCRQGLDGASAPGREGGARDGPVRLAFFGRLDRTKGLDLVIDALARLPDAALGLDIYAIGGEDDYGTALKASAAKDGRVAFKAPVEPARVSAAMADYDAIVIPSRWLETGPLVALEAFGAGAPVIGANLGGLAELVRDGVDGLLAQPDDVSGWETVLGAFAKDADLRARLRANVRPPRTMDECASEMAAVYSRLFSTAGQPAAST